MAIWATATTVGCSVPEALAPAPTQPPTTFVATTAAPVVAAGVCTDPSTSMGSDVASRTSRLLADAVGTWATPRSRSGVIAGADPQPGLRLHVRGVATISNSTAIPYVEVLIDPVPGLAARPDVTDPTFLVTDPLWSRGRDVVLAAAERAQSQARDGAATLVGATADGSQLSDIWGCVAALAQIVERPARIVVFSDLLQNVPAAFAGDLAETEILVVHECHENAARCTATQDSWWRDLHRHGAPGGSVMIVRPEVAGRALPMFLSGADIGTIAGVTS